MGILDIKIFSIDGGTLIINLGGEKASVGIVQLCLVALGAIISIQVFLENNIWGALTVFVIWTAMVFSMTGRGKK
jgi:hypothetical protein